MRVRSAHAIAALLLSSVLFAGRAEAVSIKDVIELTRAGLSEDVLVALVETGNRIYSLQPDDLKELQGAGVSDRVILALLRSGRTPAVPAPEVPPADRGAREQGPVVVIIGAPTQAAPVVVPVAVPVPVVVHSPIHRHRQVSAEVPRDHGLVDPAGFGRFINGGHRPPEPAGAPSKPQYWGWGGERRPDTWPAPEQSR